MSTSTPHSDGALRMATRSLNRMCGSRMVEECNTLIEAVMLMEGNDIMTRECVDKLLMRSMRRGDERLFASVAEEVITTSRSKSFRNILHTSCQEHFNTLYSNSDERLPIACTFLSHLLIRDVISKKIIDTCILTCLMGPLIDKSHVPQAHEINSVCKMLDICASIIDREKVHYYYRRLEGVRDKCEHPAPLMVDIAVEKYQKGYQLPPVCNI